MPATATIADLQMLVSRRFGAASMPGCGAPVAASEQNPLPLGIPSGKLTEIFGARSSGKTTLAFAALAACTRAGGLGAYIDPGGHFFAPAATDAGIDVARVILVRPREAAQIRRAVDALVRGGACGIVVLDCADVANVLQTHHCARLVAQAEKTGTALLVISSGGAQAVASFASLRLHAGGLEPRWQEGSDGGARLAGCAMAVEIAKARALVPQRSVAIEAALPAVAGTWPCE